MTWERREVALKFQIGDFTILSIKLPLEVQSIALTDGRPPLSDPAPPLDRLPAESAGFLYRAMPVMGPLPSVRIMGEYIRYVPLQYRHNYIEMSASFEEYQRKFSSKTRSTIQRKIRKYREHCGGSLSWRTYRKPEEMPSFFLAARAVSAKSYQERLLDAGLPDTDGFRQQALTRAAQDGLRAFVLFDGERPVSYLYCPVDSHTLIYAYLGYDPDYIKMSVGTILQWLALQELFSEMQFKIFDFTEGQAEHKRLFSTHERPCANVFFLRPSLRNRLLVHSHDGTNQFSRRLGDAMDRLGAKSKIRRLLRHRA